MSRGDVFTEDATGYGLGLALRCKWRRNLFVASCNWTATLTLPDRVVSKPEHVKTAFQDSDRHCKASNNDSGYLMSQVLGKCLGLISGDDYRALHHVLGPFFTYTQSGEYLERIQQRTSEYLEHQHLRGGGLKQRLQIDPVEDFKFLPFLIVADILYGPLSSEMEGELLSMAPLREKLFQHVIAGGLSRFPLSRFLPTEANRVLRTFQQRWMAFNARAYQRALADGISDTVVVKLFQAAKQRTISWDHCHQTLDEMLFANLDVTMGALSWNLVHLADNSGVQQDLRQEVNNVVADGYKQYMQSSTTLLAACILESSRLRPLAAFTVPQSAPTERLIDGYLIPARTSIVVDAHALNVKSSLWGEERSVYRPQRFSQLTRSDMRYQYWRFGFGPRQCLGKYVAELILRTILASMVQRFKLRIPTSESKDWKRDQDTWISQPKIKLEVEAV